ncbi:hypothetical protein PLICRDRAFT_181065 [Plicaturopsis crispa FD-325 SS-3]|uniref:Unplaced genomic scaffold PLICRscaffold_125, whole genome shotgun sequence n=1 Tax=Plicaturopsis crispa FD-325 SS-3 TaxID=944288 RepID=A0A0C9T3W9_PLICR|nr:hypothetical protein PLICRDRAFT_181065 [Plicaturopsis crispa FD-325 SS-3]
MLAHGALALPPALRPPSLCCPHITHHIEHDRTLHNRTLCVQAPIRPHPPPPRQSGTAPRDWLRTAQARVVARPGNPHSNAHPGVVTPPGIVAHPSDSLNNTQTSIRRARNTPPRFAHRANPTPPTLAPFTEHSAAPFRAQRTGSQGQGQRDGGEG